MTVEQMRERRRQLIAEIDLTLARTDLDATALAEWAVEMCSKYRPAEMLSALIQLRSGATR